MRTIVFNKQVEPLPLKKEPSVIETYEGILTSNYKQVAKANFFQSETDSLHRIRQNVKSRLYNYSSGIEAALKLSVFAVVLSLIL